MTPDKIFVSSDPFGFMSGYYMENHPPHGEEYIRKDAILKWVKEQESCLTVSSVSSDAFQLALDMLKEKLSKL